MKNITNTHLPYVRVNMLYSYIANQQNLTSVFPILYYLIHSHTFYFIVMHPKSAQEMFCLLHIQVACTKNLISSSANFQKEPWSVLSQPTMETASTFNSKFSGIWCYIHILRDGCECFKGACCFPLYCRESQLSGENVI